MLLVWFVFFFSEKARQATGKHNKVSAAIFSLRNKQFPKPTDKPHLQRFLHSVHEQQWAASFTFLHQQLVREPKLRGAGSPAHRQISTKIQTTQRCINQTAHSPPASHKERVWNQKEQGIKSTWSASNMLHLRGCARGHNIKFFHKDKCKLTSHTSGFGYVSVVRGWFVFKKGFCYLCHFPIYLSQRKTKKQKFVCKRSTFRLPEMEEAHLTDEKLSCPQRGQDSLFHALLASSTFSVSHLKLFGKLCRQKTSLLKFTKRTWRVKKLPGY